MNLGSYLSDSLNLNNCRAEQERHQEGPYLDCARKQEELSWPAGRRLRPDNSTSPSTGFGPTMSTRVRKKIPRFCCRYRHWSYVQYREVIFSDESSFRMPRRSSKLARRSRGSDMYDPKSTVKTMKHPAAFSAESGRGSLYFVPMGETMRGPRYALVLKDHMILCYAIHLCTIFKSFVLKNWLEEGTTNV